MLTKRQRQISLMFFFGDTRKEIANRLHISEGTVQSHEQNIYAANDLRNRSDLFRYIVKNELGVDLSDLKRQVMAMACLILIIGMELCNVNAIRIPKAPRANRTTRARARRSSEYDFEDETTYKLRYV